jgi:hypothetical protein
MVVADDGRYSSKDYTDSHSAAQPQPKWSGVPPVR